MPRSTFLSSGCCSSYQKIEFSLISLKFTNKEEFTTNIRTFSVLKLIHF